MARREKRGWNRDTCWGLPAPVFEDYLGVDRVGEFLAPRVTAYFGCGDARRPEHQVRDLEEPRACGRGFFVVDVERGGPEVPRLQGVAQGFVVEEAASGGVDEYGALGHPGYLLGPDQAPRLVGEARVKAFEGAKYLLRDRGELGYDHLGTLAPRDDLLLAAGRLLDFGHVYVWLPRPVEVYGDDLGVAPKLSFQRLDHQAAEYVTVPRDKYPAYSHRLPSPSSVLPNGMSAGSVFAPGDHDLARLARVEGLVGLLRLGEREGMGYGRLGVKALAGEVFEKLPHLVEPADPRAVERQLLVQQERAGLEGDQSPLSQKDYPSPGAGRLQAKKPARRAPRAVQGDLRAMSAGQLHDLSCRALPAHQYVGGPGLLGQL